MVVILNLAYDDFTAHACLFLMMKDITLRFNSSTPDVNKFDQLFMTQSSESVS
jgi:hypothetical protein